MIIEYIIRTDMPIDNIDYFRQMGIDMDDWDFVLICPVDILYDSHEPLWGPNDAFLDSMLGEWRRKIEWYKIEWGGAQRAMGIAYH